MRTAQSPEMRFTRAIRNSNLFPWLLLLYLLPGLFAQGSHPPYMIYGRVSQPDGSPAACAIVEITGDTGINQRIYADDAGRFEIDGLPVGRYYLTAVNPSAPDQFIAPVTVDLNSFVPRRVAVNIFLRNKAATVSTEKKPGVVTLAEEMQRAPKPAKKAFEQAMKLRGEKQYEQALKKFSRSIDLFPSYFQALAERGHLLLAMRKGPEALKDFEHALELNAHYGPALRGSGLCKYQQGKYAEAIQDLEHAADAEPGNARNYYFMGISDVVLDRREQARAALQKALSIDPAGSVRAHVHLATLLIRENRRQEAAREIEIYLKAVPNAADAEDLHALLSQLLTGSKP